MHAPGTLHVDHYEELGNLEPQLQKLESTDPLANVFAINQYCTTETYEIVPLQIRELQIAPVDLSSLLIFQDITVPRDKEENSQLNDAGHNRRCWKFTNIYHCYESRYSGKGDQYCDYP